MADHPINSIMDTSMQNIKEMVDVNTIVGDPVETPDGSVIIPVSKVSFGLAAGGAEYGGAIDFAEAAEAPAPLKDKWITPVKYPFAGGSGAGVSISPVAFIVVSGGEVKVLPITTCTVAEKLVDMIPDAVEKIHALLAGKLNASRDAGAWEKPQEKI